MDLFDRVDVILNGKDEIVKDVKAFLANTENSIDERWALYEKAESLLPIETYTIHIKEVELNGYEWYDDFHYERYETVKFSYVIDKILDDLSRFKKIQINKLKEEILATGYAGFRYDW